MTIECPSCAAPNHADAPACSACRRSLSTLAVGSVLASRYDLRENLDEGGMGSVYRAFDRKLEQDVAVKVFRTDLPSNTEAVRRFRAEIDKVRAVSHPNVGPILDHGESGAFGYISMDLLAGQDLRQVLRGQPRGLPETEALSAVLQIASGVQAIHDAGIPHGDLKTAQAVRDPHGVVRIVPFGMVKDPLSPNPADEFLGTPEYMSPEHCWGYALDFRSDVYALGILAFEVFTGEVPIRGQNPTETLFKQMREEPAFEGGAGSRVPRRFVPALSRALAKAAPDRFASVREFAEALRAQAPEAQGVVPPPPPPPPPRTPTVDPPAPSAPVPAADPPRDRGSEDARKDERFTIPTDVRIRKLGPGGVLEKEERTIAHDLSRSGMRVLTSWSDLAAGDEVAIEEVGGGFSTGAIVRHVNRGSDQITRVGIEFLEKRAPDRLVGTTTSIARPRFSPVQSSSPPSATGSNPIPPPGTSGSTSAPGSSRPTPRPRNTGSTSRPRTTGSTPRSVLTSSIPRSGLTTSISRPAPASPAPLSGGGGQPPAPTPPRDLERVREEIASVRAAAKELVGESKIWEALECLAKAQALAEGTPEAHAVRILTCETQAKVPSLMRAAQQTLEDMARDDPRDVAVHSALGRIFWQAGLSARARVAFKHVLVLDPSNREALAALATLNDPTKHR